MKRIAIFVGVALAAVPVHAAKIEPISIPNVYKVMEDRAKLGTTPECTGFSALEIVDVRESQSAIGAISKEDDPTARAPVVLQGELTELLDKAARDLFTFAAVPLSVSTAPVLELSIQEFDVQAKTAVNAEFECAVALTVKLRSAAGEPCWESRRRASSTNYGRPKNTVNYTEVMSRSIDLVLFSLLGDADFLDAACTCGSALEQSADGKGQAG